ncbi:polyamine ABC transporter substrate-binding protein [Hoeflea sp. WL0058]|uniref:Putrescine-binding periplasmic protein n=1 Tax=Flavimaribacter sediminis TaxID=2865987 RepID=A0AAE2ZRY8_9HYPH|nr:polyamine ABC transporter substrate-binding protein [Flavimaribacter sediminis]MBW8639871.1 polyamine ABC transporter substrate-binding protein [Flavimaribacter sediminis]
MISKKVLLSAGVAFAILAMGANAQDRVVNVYNWSDYIAEDTLDKFTEATGIKVVYDVYDSNEVLESKLLSGNTGYDIVVPTGDFLQRQMQADVYQPLDKSKLPNLANMDAGLMKQAAEYDADNAHSVIYMWGTTGLGYNEDMIAERLGDDYVVDSWAVLFDPEVVSKLQDCGVAVLDAPTELFPAALNYLGYDPNSFDKKELEEAADLMKSVRPYIRYFHSSQYINDLANGDICLAMGWSGDLFQSRDRADEADNGVSIAYVIPKEGALQWFDVLAIPADAPHPEEAHAFINFIMDPQITADITNYVWYASANKAAMPLIDEEITSDPGIFPPQEVLDNLFADKPQPPSADRLVNRLWTSVKTGQ